MQGQPQEGNEGQGTNERRNRRGHEANGEERWNFEINWNDIFNAHPKIKKKLDAGRKLNAKLRRLVVSRVVNQVRTRVPHARRTIFVQIMTDMKRLYQRSFRHELAGGFVGKKTVAFYMQTKYDNDRRPLSRTRAETETPSFKEAYGCKQWRLASLPQQQTPESQEELRESLVDIYRTTRESAWNWEEILQKMNLTYGTLRTEINTQAMSIINTRKALLRRRRKAKGQTNQQEENEEDVDDGDLTVMTTAQIQERWPFLFQSTGMANHFERLTKVNIKDQFDDYLTNEFDRMIEFILDKKPSNKKFWKRTRRAIRHTPDLENSFKLTALVKMLISFFKEDGRFIVRVIEVSCVSLSCSFKVAANYKIFTFLHTRKPQMRMRSVLKQIYQKLLFLF